MQTSWTDAAGRIARLMLALVVLVVVLSPDAAGAQCAMCRSVFASEEGQQLAAAFRSGILFLLAAPFLAFAVVATLAVRSRPADKPAGTSERADREVTAT